MLFRSVERIGGNRDRLLGVLQERYGYTRERAEDEIARRMRDLESATRNRGSSPM